MRSDWESGTSKSPRLVSGDQGPNPHPGLGPVSLSDGTKYLPGYWGDLGYSQFAQYSLTLGLLLLIRRFFYLFCIKYMSTGNLLYFQTPWLGGTSTFTFTIEDWRGFELIIMIIGWQLTFRIVIVSDNYLCIKHTIYIVYDIKMLYHSVSFIILLVFLLFLINDKQFIFI